MPIRIINKATFMPFALWLVLNKFIINNLFILFLFVLNRSLLFLQPALLWNQTALLISWFLHVVHCLRWPAPGSGCCQTVHVRIVSYQLPPVRCLPLKRFWATANDRIADGLMVANPCRGPHGSS